jgi:preprotein translocase subunit SecG
MIQFVNPGFKGAGTVGFSPALPFEAAIVYSAPPEIGLWPGRVFVQAILIAVELIVAVALIVTVLLQRSEGGALGMGGGGSGLGGLFSPRGAADTLTRTTSILAALFFLTCLGLNLLALHGRDEKSFLESGPTAAPAVPVTPAKPLVPTGPSVPTPH